MSWLLKSRDLQTLQWLTLVFCFVLVVHLLRVGGLSGDLRQFDGEASGPPRYRVDLNRGAWIEYVMVPGIGEKTARAIVQWRDRHGSFDSVEQLDQVPGIGPVTRDKAREYLFISRRDSP